jgi:hypothetical protein
MRYTRSGPFIARLMEFSSRARVKRPPSSALEFALEYGKAHLIPLLTPIWPLPERSPSRGWRRGLRASEGLV